MSTTARVLLWGRDIGAVTWLDERALGVFQFVPEFVDSGIQVAPLTMPLQEAPYEFPALWPRSTAIGPGKSAANWENWSSEHWSTTVLDIGKRV